MIPDPSSPSGDTGTPMPVFTIKAKDALAVPTVRRYKELCEEFGLHHQAWEVQQALNEILLWQEANIDATKLPDHNHEPVLPPEPVPPA